MIPRPSSQSCRTAVEDLDSRLTSVANVHVGLEENHADRDLVVWVGLSEQQSIGRQYYSANQTKVTDIGMHALCICGRNYLCAVLVSWKQGFHSLLCGVRRLSRLAVLWSGTAEPGPGGYNESCRYQVCRKPATGALMRPV